MSFANLMHRLKNSAHLATDKAEETDKGQNPEIIAKMRSMIDGFCVINIPKPIEVYTPDEMDSILTGASADIVGVVYHYLGVTNSTYRQGVYYLIEEVTE